MELLLKKVNGALVPHDTLTADRMTEINDGEWLLVRTKKARNGKFHAKFFSLLKLGYENQDRYDNFTSFRHEVTMRAGWYDVHVTLKGNQLFIPKSLSFENMDDVEFRELFSKSLNVILKHFMHGASEEEVMKVIGYD